MVELEHARSILSELGLATASELLDAKIEDAMHKEATYLGFLSELLNAEIQEKRRRSELQVENANRDELKKRITDMSTFLKKQPTALTEYDEQLIRRLIEKVTVYEDKFTVEFKSGVTVDNRGGFPWTNYFMSFVW